MRRRRGEAVSDSRRDDSARQPTSSTSSKQHDEIQKPRSTTKRIGIYEVTTHEQPWSERLPLVGAARSFAALRESLPFIVRLFRELAIANQGWTIIVFWLIGIAIKSFLPAYELWLSSELLQETQRAIDLRFIKDQDRFISLVLQRAACVVLNRAVVVFLEKQERTLSNSIDRIFTYRVLAAKLRLSLGTLSDPDTQRIFNSLGVGGGQGRGNSRAFAGLVRGFTGLMSFVGVASQGVVLLGMVRQRESDRIYAAVALLSYGLSRLDNQLNYAFTMMGLIVYPYYESKIVDEDYLHLGRLSGLGDSKYKAEVESLGLNTWALENYRNTSSRLGPALEVDLQEEMRKRRFSVLSPARDLLQHFPMIHLAYRASHLPSTVPLSLATVTLVQSTTTRFITEADRFTKVGGGLASQAQSFKDLYELEEMEDELKSGDVPYVAGGGMSVEFRNVSYTYPGSKKPSLEHVNFKLEAGQLAICVGVNGGGKSTMMKLLARLFDPTEGEVIINGRNAKEYVLSDLRRALAVLWQDYVHFPLTIGQNIALGDAATPFDQEAVEAAARAGYAHDFVSALPLGYQTHLDQPQLSNTNFSFRPRGRLQQLHRRMEEEKERELKLSGGQWQRLALSRTLMRAAKVDLLAFDEPSASLDSKAEADLFKTLNDVRKNKTAFYITHRFGAINRQADLVLYLDQGRVVEQGTHAELQQKGGVYAELYNLQSSAFNADI